MGLTQNYYNWIRAIKFGIGTTTRKQWTDMPDRLRVKTDSGALVNPALFPNVSGSYIYYDPFENIQQMESLTTNRGMEIIIPSSNPDEESINDYATTTSTFISNFDTVGSDLTRTVDWENSTATLKAKYINKTSAAQTVYGMELIKQGVYLYNQQNAWVLFYRKKFDTPITVQPGEIIELSLTWEVA